ncbi:MAG TPA: transaldolase [Chloroflexota bacterium]|nr:transaldolase [Chloroflexota bacterium]
MSARDLRVRIFADGADLDSMARLVENPLVSGFTTNPTLMRKAGVRDYKTFAREVLALVGDRPVSFEVFSDELEEMERQADVIASWGGNVFVKIPVTNTTGTFLGPLVERLSRRGVQVNVTALMTAGQVADVVGCLAEETSSFVSLFAGRIADTGRDPMPVVADAVGLLTRRPKAQLIWASSRELLNVFQADSVGCQVITVTPDLLAKLPLIGKDLLEYSLETVRMFREDAVKAGYSIETALTQSA